MKAATTDEVVTVLHDFSVDIIEFMDEQNLPMAERLTTLTVVLSHILTSRIRPEDRAETLAILTRKALELAVILDNLD